MISLTDREFGQIQALMFQQSGIRLSSAKKPLVCGRLSKRLQALGLSHYGDYFDLIGRPDQLAERQIAVDLLTTNETFFFREPKHFDFLSREILPRHPAGKRFRIWSAASSSGEEAYSLAMVLAERWGLEGWEIMGSDLSTRVLAAAQHARYPMERAGGISAERLKKYCLKGVRSQEGYLMIDRSLRERVQFRQLNLVDPLPQLGEFDVIFLRNVMIYFELEVKRQVVANLLPALKKGGYLMIGHSESLNGVSEALELVRPAIYRRMP